MGEMHLGIYFIFFLTGAAKEPVVRKGWDASSNPLISRAVSGGVFPSSTIFLYFFISFFSPSCFPFCSFTF